MKSQKTVFLRFFQFSAKTTIFYQKRFKDLIFHHQNKLWFKCSKKWSGSSVTMLPWSLCLAQKLKSPKFGQIRCISNCVWNIDKYIGNVLEKRDRSLGWLSLRSAAVHAQWTVALQMWTGTLETRFTILRLLMITTFRFFKCYCIFQIFFQHLL